MIESPAIELDSDHDERDRLLSVVLENAPLGGPVSFDVGPRSTVLIGRNGSGKSLILEGCLLNGPKTGVPLPLRLKIELGRPGDRIGYEFTSKPSDPFGQKVGVIERCWQVETNKELWRAPDREISVEDARSETRTFALTLLQSDLAARRAYDLFLAVGTIPAGTPRSGGRYDVLLNTKSGQPTGPLVNPRVVEMARTIGSWADRNPDRLEALRALGRRTGLVETIEVLHFQAGDAPAAFAQFFLDGTDIGHLADGTLRGLEILIDLLDPRIGTLLIEEPETGVHPGLLHRLLAEIDAHTHDRQVILTTHSPIVVDWADPDDLRLVERQGGKSTVRTLDPGEITRVRAFLNDEGTLSEFVFGQENGG